MVGVDTGFLSLILHPKAKAPADPRTGKPIKRLKERIEKLIEDLDSDNERIIVPTPVLAEFLVFADKEAQDYLDKLSNAKTFILEPFDQLSAVELAAIELTARSKGGKRSGSQSPWQKIKIDRQIVATVKAHGGKRIYSDDPDVIAFGKQAGLTVVSSWELPEPPSKTPLFDSVEEADAADAS